LGIVRIRKVPMSRVRYEPMSGATGRPSIDSLTQPGTNGVRLIDHQHSGDGKRTRPAS
jgi:hypothetical protein